MGVFVLFVSPGVRAGDAALAKARYDGDDEAFAGLDAGRVREIADELTRAHGLAALAEEDREPDDDGVELEEPGENGGVAARVDRWGVTVSTFKSAFEGETRKAIGRALAAARTASRLVGGAVYDPDRDRIVDVSSDEPELVEAALAAIRSASAQTLGERRGLIASTVFTLLPLAALAAGGLLAKGVSRGVVLTGFLVFALALAAWGRRALRRAPAVTAGSPPPARAERVSGSDPIRPS